MIPCCVASFGKRQSGGSMYVACNLPMSLPAPPRIQFCHVPIDPTCDIGGPAS